MVHVAIVEARPRADDGRVLVLRLEISDARVRGTLAETVGGETDDRAVFAGPRVKA